MNFKQLLIFFITFYFFSFSFSPISYGQGGLSYKSIDPITKNVVEFIEKQVFQFQIEVEHIQLVRLEDQFNAAVANGAISSNYAPAGFCFIPIRKSEDWPIDNDNTTIDTIGFITKGFYVVLTLYRSGQPNEVKLFLNDTTYDVLAAINELNNPTTTPTGILSLSDLNPPGTSNATSFEEVQYIPIPTPPATPEEPMVFNTREFDLVYLDMTTYISFATSGRYYDATDPNIVGGGRQRNGLFIKRSFSSLDTVLHNPNSYSFYDTRTLMFRPSTPPELTDYNSEAAFAYDKGIECPPWWKDPTEEGFLAVVETQIKNKQAPPPSEPRSPWDEKWFRWLISVIIALLTSYAGVNIYNNGFPGIKKSN